MIWVLLVLFVLVRLFCELFRSAGKNGLHRYLSKKRICIYFKLRISQLLDRIIFCCQCFSIHSSFFCSASALSIYIVEYSFDICEIYMDLVSGWEKKRKEKLFTLIMLRMCVAQRCNIHYYLYAWMREYVMLAYMSLNKFEHDMVWNW